MMQEHIRRAFAMPIILIMEENVIFYRKRPKWHQRATMTSVILYELATAIGTGVKPPMLQIECVEYLKG